MPKPNSLLLIAADTSEVEGLTQLLPFQRAATGLLRCTDPTFSQLDLLVLPEWGACGVEKGLSTIDTEYTNWINIGFAGCCTPHDPLGECFTIHSVQQLSQQEPTLLSPLPTLPLEPLPQLPTHPLVTSPVPYTFGFHDTYRLVDMEGYPIAQAAKKQAVPCSMIKITSDYTLPSDRGFLTTQKSWLSQQLATTVISILHGMQKYILNKKEYLEK